MSSLCIESLLTVYICITCMCRHVRTCTCISMLYVSTVSSTHCSGIYAFVILKDNVVASVESIAEDLKTLVKKKIASFALPNEFLVSENVFVHCVSVSLLV